MKGKKYSTTFKEDALKLSDREGVKSASEKLGITPRHIYAWRKTKQFIQTGRPKGLKPGETIEEGFQRIERECDELLEANNILKKAMFFLVGR
jgi:transposase-like protein